MGDSPLVAGLEVGRLNSFRKRVAESLKQLRELRVSSTRTEPCVGKREVVPGESV
jgi:hypothetical protein